MIVGLRHDVDEVCGLRWGVHKVISLEEKYGVRSTFFVRFGVVPSDEDCSVLRRIVDDVWEVLCI